MSMDGADGAHGDARRAEDRVRLIAFDVDGTLVEHDRSEVIWQILNRRFTGDMAVNAARYQAFLRGELAYAEWVRLDVEGWIRAGATRQSITDAISQELRLVPGADRVIHSLRERGYALAVVSGTLDIVLDVLFADHPFQFVFTNEISFDAAGEIRSWKATRFDMHGKADALQMLAARLGLGRDELAFVGDHVNDCSALGAVGCPVAYDPKHETVRAAARHVVPRGCFGLLLDLFGGVPRRGRVPRRA